MFDSAILLPVCFLRWGDHPLKKAAMNNMSKSELSRRRWVKPAEPEPEQ